MNVRPVNTYAKNNTETDDKSRLKDQSKFLIQDT